MKSNKKLTGPHPPQWAQRFFSWFCKAELWESLSGDLEEEFIQRTNEKGLSYAKRVYVFQVLSFLRPFAMRIPTFFHTSSVSILAHYVKVARRNLMRQKVASTLKVLGLSLGLSVCMLIFLYVSFEFSYDTFHQDHDRIFRIYNTLTFPGSTYERNLLPPGILAAMQPYISMVDKAARIDVQKFTLQTDAHAFYGIQTVLADSGFFHVFDFPLTNCQSPVFKAEPGQAYLTASLANKLFPHQDPKGKMLRIPRLTDTLLVEVMGVLKDVPSASHIQFECVITNPVRTPKKPFTWDRALHAANAIYVKVHGGASEKDLASGLAAFIHKTGGDTLSKYQFELNVQKLADIHLHSHHSEEFEINGSTREVYIFLGIGLLILALSINNYILLVLTDFTKRIKEIGIRKVNGANPRILLVQFFTEALFYIIIAVPFILIFCYFFLSPFSSLVEKQLQWEMLWESAYLWAIPWIVLAILLLMATYPSFLFAQTGIQHALKKKVSVKHSSMGVRKGILVVQFAVVLSLMISLGVVFKQMKFIQEKDVGFETKDKLIIKDFKLQQKTLLLKQQLMESPFVETVALSKWIPGENPGAIGKMKVKIKGEEQFITYVSLLGDKNLIEAYQFELIKGSNFEKEAEEEVGTIYFKEGAERLREPIIVNETLLRMLGLAFQVGQVIDHESLKGTVIGIIKDFHIGTFHEPISPLYIELHNATPYLVISFLPHREQEVIAHLASTWNGLQILDTPEYFFLEDHMRKLYGEENRLMNMLLVFSCIAIGIACLGVLGLAAFEIERRAKEVSIRKVLGAKLSDILLLLNAEYLKLATIGSLIGIPTAIYAMQQWLERFAYRINIGPIEILFAICLVFGVAIMTVSLRSLQVALSNPIEALRDE